MTPAERVGDVFHRLMHRPDKPRWFDKQLMKLAKITDPLEGGVETVCLLLDLSFGVDVPRDVRQSTYALMSEISPRELLDALRLRIEVAKIVGNKKKDGTVR